MILEPRDVPEVGLSARIAVLGAGAAGITMALKFARLGHEVILVTGGARAQTAANRDLMMGSVFPPKSHEPLEWHRYRSFGGGTRVWGGRLVRFDPIDFEDRPFVPLGRWPLDPSEITSRYPEAAEWCEAHDERFLAGPTGPDDVPDSLGAGLIDASTCERWSMPTDFSVRYRDELSRSAAIKVLMDCHVVELRLDGSGERVVETRCAARGRSGFPVRAELFVLAAGALENARVLLASRGQRPAGLGNEHDMVGRCYMSHIAAVHGRVRFNRGGRPDFYRLEKDRHGEWFRRRFRLSDEAQRKLEVLNIIGFPLRPAANDPSHGDPVLSAMSVGRSFGNLLRLRFPRPGPFAAHGWNVLRGGPSAWSSIFRQSLARLERRRLPYVLPHRPDARDAFFFQSEQAPQRESRVVLSEERDEFGMPRLEARIRFLEIDLRTVIEFYRVLDEALRASGMGYMEYRPEELRSFLERFTGEFDSAHHLGTTRMSRDPRDGVVDGNLKVHSLPNLYVVGGSTFPTGSHANPTMTIVAIASRLVDHVANQILVSGTVR